MVLGSGGPEATTTRGEQGQVQNSKTGLVWVDARQGQRGDREEVNLSSVRGRETTRGTGQLIGRGVGVGGRDGSPVKRKKKENSIQERVNGSDLMPPP